MRLEHTQYAVLIAVALLPIGLLSGCGARSETSDATPANVGLPEVTVVQATRQDMVRTVDITGTLAPLPNHEARVSAPFAGRLASVDVQPDQYVTAGTVVAQMSTDSLDGQIDQARAAIAANEVQVDEARVNADEQRATTRTQIAQAQAALAGSQAQADNAQQNLDRLQGLFKDGLVSEKDVEDAQMQVKTSRAEVDAQDQAVEAAKASVLSDVAKQQEVAIARDQVASGYGALRVVQFQLALANIVAPISGVVTDVPASSGEAVDTTTPLLTIVDTRALQATLAAPPATLRFVQPGDEVHVSTDALPGQSFDGVVRSVGVQEDPVSGTVPVTVSLENTDRLLKDDMQVSASIVVERRRNAVVVPQSAILTDPLTESTTVLVVDADGTAHVRPVKVGLELDGSSSGSSGAKSAEILSGLSRGDRVAVTGQYGLSDGSKVSVHGAS